MKKISVCLILMVAITACGGGSEDTVVALATNQTMYGFDAKGAPYSARLDLQNDVYEYSQVNAATGASNGVVALKITPQTDSPNVYKVYGHEQHFLAMDKSQTALLATTKSTDSATVEPTLFATQALDSLKDIAGSYYQTHLGPFWTRLNVTTTGAISFDCKNFSAIQVSGEVSKAYDSCALITISKASLKALSPPYWKLTYEIKFKDLDGYSEYTSTVLFAKSATGRVAYTGGNASRFCNQSGACNALNTGSAVWQEAQNFTSPVNYTGSWVFNRQGATSSYLNLNASGMGSTSSGLAVTANFSMETKNIDATRNVLDVASYENTALMPTSSLIATMVAPSIVYGRSKLKNLGGNIAMELSPVNSSALFNRVALDTKTFTLLPNGTSGPYVVPLASDEVDRLAKYDVFIETLQAGGSTVMDSKQLVENADYGLDRLSGEIQLRSPVYFLGSDARLVRLAVKAYLTPVGISANPVAWGVRVR